MGQEGSIRLVLRAAARVGGDDGIVGEKRVHPLGGEAGVAGEARLDDEAGDDAVEASVVVVGAGIRDQ